MACSLQGKANYHHLNLPKEIPTKLKHTHTIYIYLYGESLTATSGLNCPWDLPSAPAEAWEEAVRLCSTVEHFHALGFRLLCNLYAKFCSPYHHVILLVLTAGLSPCLKKNNKKTQQTQIFNCIRSASHSRAFFGAYWRWCPIPRAGPEQTLECLIIACNTTSEK